MKTSFTIFVGAADQYLTITPFTATSSCGKFLWKYSGVDPLDGHILIFENDLMSVNPKNGTIKVSQQKPLGTYFVKVVGELSDF